MTIRNINPPEILSFLMPDGISVTLHQQKVLEEHSPAQIQVDSRTRVVVQRANGEVELRPAKIYCTTMSE